MTPAARLCDCGVSTCDHFGQIGTYIDAHGALSVSGPRMTARAAADPCTRSATVSSIIHIWTIPGIAAITAIQQSRRSFSFTGLVPRCPAPISVPHAVARSAGTPSLVPNRPSCPWLRTRCGKTHAHDCVPEVLSARVLPCRRDPAT